MSKWWRAHGALLGLVTSFVLTGCGGGGGGSDKPANNVQAVPSNTVSMADLSANRRYGDQWGLAYTDTLDNTSKTYQLNYAVDGVLDQQMVTLSATRSDTGELFTELRDAGNSTLARSDGGCTYTREPSQAGSNQTSWTSTYTQACVNTDIMDVQSDVLANTTWGQGSMKAALPNLPVKKIRSVITNRTRLTPNTPISIDQTCLWSPDLGMSVHCDVVYDYATGPTGKVRARSFDLVSFHAGTSALAPAPASSTYPAFTPTMPMVSTDVGVYAPQVIGTPKLQAIYYSDTGNQTTLNDLLSKLTTSSLWRQLSEYGVGQGSVSSAYQVGSTAPKTLRDSDVFQIVSNLVNSHSVAVDANSFLLVFLPASSTLSMSNGPAACSPSGPGAFHSYVTLFNGMTVPFAVIPDCGHGIGEVTAATSHEILEGVVDPAMRGYRTVSTDMSWAFAFSGAEIGDMCEHLVDGYTTPADIGYRVARVWSNKAASSYHHPCQPLRSINPADVFFASVPVMQDMVTIRQGKQSGNTHGVVIAPGASVTIAVQLFSDAPTQGQWQVRAHQVMPAPSIASAAQNLTFKWDRTSGQNGDVLALTITAPITAAPDGIVFIIESSYAGRSMNWAGAVANAPAFAF